MKASFKLLSLPVIPFIIISLFLLSCSDNKDNGELKIKYFVLGSNDLSFDIVASEQIVEIKTNLTGITVEVSESWCKAEVNDQQIKVSVETADDDLDERKAEITLKSSTETRVITVTQSALNDLKISVSGAESDYAHSANPIAFSCDNDYNTYFMSHWSQTTFPFNVIYNFEDIKKIDFFRYHPKADGATKPNGLLGRLEVWYATISNPEFVKYGEYDFEMKFATQEIAFTPALTNPTKIKFVLYKGYGTGTYAAIGEMEFYRAGKKK